MNQAVLVLEGGTDLKVFSNDMVDMSRFVSFDPKEYGINEKVRFSRPAGAAGYRSRGRLG